MRCFIALELDDAIKGKLQFAQQLFKGVRGGRIGWCSREQMHLTLKFLGEAAEDMIPKIVQAIETAARDIPPFDMIVEGLGAFPPSGSPRVLWVGVRENDILTRLQQRIEDNVSPLGFAPEDRRFTPHLTLGRVKERIDARACRDIIQRNKDLAAGTQHVRRIVLFSSTLRPTGAIYDHVAEIPLSS